MSWSAALPSLAVQPAAVAEIAPLLGASLHREPTCPVPWWRPASRSDGNAIGETTAVGDPGKQLASSIRPHSGDCRRWLCNSARRADRCRHATRYRGKRHQRRSTICGFGRASSNVARDGRKTAVSRVECLHCEKCWVASRQPELSQDSGSRPSRGSFFEDPPAPNRRSRQEPPLPRCGSTSSRLKNWSSARFDSSVYCSLHTRHCKVQPQ